MFTTEQKRKALERELGLRKNNYPKRVATGFMTQKQADEQIAIFRAIRDDYALAELSEKINDQ